MKKRAYLFLAAAVVLLAAGCETLDWVQTTPKTAEDYRARGLEHQENGDYDSAIADFTETKEIKIVIYNDGEKEFLENFILYKRYDVEMIYDGRLLIIKNINEDILIDIIRVVKLNSDIIADNMANVNTTRTVNGGPYIRKYLKISVEDGVEIVEDTRSPLNYRWDPSHPDAIATGIMQGYVRMPNVDIVLEMVDMISKSRLYERIFEYAKDTYKNIIW